MRELHSLKDSFEKELGTVSDTNGLELLRVKYAGKKGLVAEQMKLLASIPAEDKKAFGQKVNELKDFVNSALDAKKETLKAGELSARLKRESIDATLPGDFRTPGREHPINQILEELSDIFVSMGFDVEEGPEVEEDYYNFEALNMPKDHPARDMQDTFYVSGDVVLRTHTSPVQIRVMKKRKPPLRMIAPGKVYRCDADVSHTPMFHQLEGLVVDKGISFSHLKGVLEVFVHRVFSPDTPVRFRPSFFPFTEPSAEVDIGCIFCKGQGCGVCKRTGWIEILGAGMVNPKVLRMCDIDPDEYSGFAFGLGMERIAMLKFSIDDIRMYFANDVRFLSQF